MFMKARDQGGVGERVEPSPTLPPVDPRTPLRIRRDEVRAFLLDHRYPASPTVLRAAGLAAFAYCALPADDPRRGELRGDYLGSLRRHQIMRGEVTALVRAWADAGVEALLFKGFHLAEFVYPKPGMRFHGDVDILVRPEHEEAALAVARENGWAETPRRFRQTHEICGLYGPAGTKVDLHRYIVHRKVWGRAQPRITRAVWERSERFEWEGTTVRVPHDVDAFVVGLVVQRLWSEAGYLKPHDPIDARLLSARVSREAVVRRARELRCERTLRHFFERCDPDRGRLDLVPSRAARMRREWILRRERGLFTGRWIWVRRLLLAPGLALDVARVLPDIVATRRRLQAEPDLRRLFEEATPPVAPVRSSPRRRLRTVRAIRWATRFLRLNPGGDCVLRSLAIYRALRREGWPVVFVSGVRREGGRIDGHAWVEFDGRVLPELGEPAVDHYYNETFRWPMKSSGPTKD